MKILLPLFLSLSLGATTFQIQPIERQIKDADGAIQGNFLSKRVIELENGKIATQMIFKMTKEFGLQSDFFGMDEVIIHYPGGELGNKRTYIEGTPQFVSGEKVVIFVKSVENRYWGMNLGFGSYRVVNYGNKVMMVNYLFPKDPKVGQIHLVDFEKTFRSIKGSGFKTVYTPQYPSEKERQPASEQKTAGKNRSIASKSEAVENEKRPLGWSPMGLIAVLSILGGLFRFNRQRRTR